VAPGYCNAAALRSWTRLIGIAPQVVSTYLDSSAWARIANPADQLACWAPVQKAGARMSFGVPILPSTGAGSLAAGAAGAYDAYFQTLAQNLVTSGYSTAYLRLGWEFNGSWQPWRAGANPTAFKAYYSRLVRIMRAVPGARFTFVWTITSGPTETSALSLYPGNQVVDMIGLDTYDAAYTQGTFPIPRGAGAKVVAQRRASAWAEQSTGYLGLNAWAAFASKHHKRLALAEWGLVGNAGPGSEPHGGGDDAAYVKHMAAWMASHHVTYGSYFNAAANLQSVLGSDTHGFQRFPKATKAFTQAFKAPKTLPKH
jgi:hypothetical protein